MELSEENINELENDKNNYNLSSEIAQTIGQSHFSEIITNPQFIENGHVTKFFG